MIETKLFEVRDEGTHVPMFATLAWANGCEREHAILRRAGYSDNVPALVVIGSLCGGQVKYDPYEWGDRTFRTAHHFIEKNWDILQSGAVIDVRHILGEVDTPCESELTP